MLTMNNQSNYLRKELTVRLLKSFFYGNLKETIDKLPIEMNPRKNASYRCCIYRDRAMTRYRIMALLGISIEQEDDEFKPLGKYLEEALNRPEISKPVMTVLDTACSSCERVSYKVTDACRGCLARPCRTNCPFDAITFINGKAVINRDLCRNCGKCLELCPYNAIVHIPVPCEENCPVGAISRDENGSMFIDYKKCISCGRCSRSCPFGAVMERSQIIDVASILKKDKPAVALLAPSAIGQFPGSLGQLAAAVKKAGFRAVFDVASGAAKTAELEAAEFSEREEEARSIGGNFLMTTSCCPAWIETAEKHIPEMKKHVSRTGTPMYYTAREAAAVFPNAPIVFIGPCTAKKNEALRDGSVDYVLSFEELGAFFIALGIEVNECEEENFCNADNCITDSLFQARGFAASGGVSEAVTAGISAGLRKEFRPLSVDGLSKKNFNLLKTASAGRLNYNMIEVMSCEGGCICGPGVISNPKIARKKLEECRTSA